MVEATRKETTPYVVGYCGTHRQVHLMDHQFPQQMTMARQQTPPKVVVPHPPGPLRGIAFLPVLRETPQVHPDPPDESQNALARRQVIISH